MGMSKIMSVTLAPWVLVAGYASAAPAVDLAAERAAIAAADREFDAATAKGGAEAWASYFAEDGLMLSDREGATHGREAIRKAMEPFFSNPDVSLRWTPLLQEVSNDATLGYTVGRYRAAAKTPEGEPVSLEGKYLSVWRKVADGTWKVAVDLGNPGLPFAEGTEPPTAVREAAGAPASRGAKAEEDALRRTIKAFQKAVAERGAEGWAEHFAADGVQYVYGKSVLVGREAILDFSKKRFAAGGVLSLVWEPLSVELSGDASLAVTYGWFERKEKGEDGEEKVVQGKYTTVWRKQADGSFKVAVDVGNYGLPGLSPNEGTQSKDPS